MITILSEYELELLLSRIEDNGKELLSPLKRFRYSFNFYEMYKKIIKLYDKAYNKRLINKSVTFQEKFEISVVAANQSKIPDFQKKFIDNICKIPIDNENSRFSNDLKSDGLNLSYVAIYCLRFNQINYVYSLIDYLHENISTITIENIEEFYSSIRFLLDYIWDIVEKERSNNKILDMKILLLLSKIRDIHFLYSVASDW